MDAENFAAEISLPQFQISPETGFMPATPPLPRLPGQYFAQWEDLAGQLPQLIESKQLRAEVDRLPELEFNSTTLQTEEEWRRAYTLLCFIGQSYIWMDGQKGIVDKIPRKIAVPWCEVSKHLDMKPVGCYASTTLYNYALRDPKGPWSADNLYATTTFTGTKDESGFYMTFLLIELAAVPALRAIEQVYRDMSKRCDEGVQECLQAMQKSLYDMRINMKTMFEQCDPVTFYVQIRPFQAGSKGFDVFPNGICYEGVDSLFHQYHGANAGQSSVIYAIDTTLGTHHYGDGKNYMDTMKLYMPQKHREFLHRLREMPSIRDYCVESGNADLIASFNSTAKELQEFRTDHFILVTRYIVNQQRHSVNPTMDKKGSGGTDFMKLLKKIRNETTEVIIK